MSEENNTFQLIFKYRKFYTKNTLCKCVLYMHCIIGPPTHERHLLNSRLQDTPDIGTGTNYQRILSLRLQMLQKHTLVISITDQ